MTNLNLSYATVGIELWSSSNNTITGNTICNNNDGVYLRDLSNNNTITGNTICNNSNNGIYLRDSSNNVIYLNKFIDNNVNAYNYNGTNYFDNGTYGNYWSDYTGVDADSDGIGDTPYYIEEDAIDNYPLMSPANITIDILGPQFMKITWTPEEPEEDEVVTVLANITDESGINTAILSYFDGTWHNVTMTYSSTQNLWMAVIPGMPANQEVRFKIYARDSVGNWAVSQEYSYIVARSGSTGGFLGSLESIYIPLGVLAAAGVAIIFVIIRKRR